MSMNNLNLYRDVVEKSYGVSSPLLLATALGQIKAEKDELLAALSKGNTIKVPIVGDFNAGKSSLINAFVGRSSLLPVEITPETAVAYELYYSVNEYVELYRDDIKVDERPIESIKDLNVKPGDICKVYVASPKIKELADRGITIVDMPGIDSGIQEHNDAILHYINNGSSFVLLSDSANGSLRQTTISFMTELSKYNISPAVLLSKSDKKPADELQQVVELVTFQSRKAIGGETFVGTISSHSDDIQAFETYLSMLDAEKMIKARFASRVASFLNTQLAYLSSQGDLLKIKVTDLAEKLAKLEQEKNNAVELLNNNPNADTPEKSSQDVLDLVADALMVHSEEIATMIADKEDKNEINARIINYIRPVLILAFREEGEQYAEAMSTAVDEISSKLEDSAMIDSGIINDIVDDFRGDILGGIQLLKDVLQSIPHVYAVVLGWVLEFFGERIPDLLKMFFGKDRSTIIVEVVQKIQATVIPKIVEGLRPAVYERIVAQQARIRESVENTVNAGIGNIQESLSNSAEAVGRADAESQIAAIEAAIVTINTLKASI